jgi:hypothetical protein
MNEKLRTMTLALTPAIRKTRRVVKLSTAILLAAAALAIAAPGHADAQEVDPSIADSDGIVPIIEVCFGSDASEPLVPGAAYIPFYVGNTVEGVIVFDSCVAEELGLGPTDIQLTLAHELGHAQGLLHSSDPSSIMYPVLPITGT